MCTTSPKLFENNIFSFFTMASASDRILRSSTRTKFSVNSWTKLSGSFSVLCNKTLRTCHNSSSCVSMILTNNIIFPLSTIYKARAYIYTSFDPNWIGSNIIYRYELLTFPDNGPSSVGIKAIIVSIQASLYKRRTRITVCAHCVQAYARIYTFTEKRTHTAVERASGV